MKPQRTLILVCLIEAVLLASPVVVQAQFTFTTNCGSITITGYTGTNGNVVIPEMTNGYRIIAIGDYAFVDNPFVTNVNISACITNVGNYVFANCIRLNTIDVSVSNLFYATMNGVLFNRNKVQLIQYPAGKGENSYTIPNSVVIIGNAAFYAATSLTNVTIPNGVKSIGLEAFYACNLICVKIPDGNMEIGSWAFWYCTSLTTITIPSSVSSIGGFAFANCVNLRGIYFDGDAPRYMDSLDFADDAQAIAYYLPGTTGWEDFAANTGLGTAFWMLPNPSILNSEPNFGIQNVGFGFTISWATNVAVAVDACTDLSNPLWQPVQTNTLTSGTSYFSDPQWTNYPTRFYRVRSAP